MIPRVLMAYLIIAISAFCVTSLAYADTYKNPSYGIELAEVDGWHLTESAKLSINLKTLSTEQLSELFRAYQQGGIVGLSEREEARVPKISIKFTVSRRETTLELSAGYSTGGRTRKRLLKPAEMKIGNVTGFYSVVQNNNVDVAFHHFIVKRNRTFVVVTAQMSGDDLKANIATVTHALSGLKLDLDAD